MPCPCCGRDWPHRRFPSLESDAEIDWTCAVCLHAEVAALRRASAALEAAIRRHRNERGDDRCWRDDEVLYAALPDGHMPQEYEVAVEIENCLRYIACRRNPATVYVSPQREIERLRAIIQSKS